MTVEQLANKANVSIKFIGDVERGQKMPSINTFIKIVNALDVSFDYVLSQDVVAAKPKTIEGITDKIMDFNLNQLNLLRKIVNDIEEIKDSFK